MFKEAIKTLLIAKRLNQSELAEMCGVTRASVSLWINGRANPSLSRIRQIEEALNLVPGTLFVAAVYTSVS